MKKWMVLLLLIVSMSEAKQRCIQEKCTEWIKYPDGSKKCIQKKCTKWEKILEKIEDKVDPNRPRVNCGGATRG